MNTPGRVVIDLCGGDDEKEGDDAIDLRSDKPTTPPAHRAARQLVTPSGDSAAAGRAGRRGRAGGPAAASRATVAWTPEQQQVIALARPPLASGHGRVVCVTSGAGTGKTTTIEGVAQRLVELGHTDVRYVAFNKVAAAEARRRFRLNRACASIVLAQTSHATAFSLVPGAQGGVGPLSDVGLEQQLKELLAPELARALRHVPGDAQPRTRGLLVFYVRKTLELFVHSAKTAAKGLDDSSQRAALWNTYYPAKLYHQGEKGQPPPGLPNLAAAGFYVRCAQAAWQAMTTGRRFFTFDSVLKAAQLGVVRIAGASALLVDESQDLNAAQVSWLSAQALFGIDVFFVGDAAQTIYSFRGAKAKYISQLGAAPRDEEPALIASQPRLPAVLDARLTVSFRFGPQIAAAANAVLLSKTHSAQTHPDPAKALWTPYYVTGGAAQPGRVLQRDLLAARAWPLTLIARSNVALLNAALPVLAGGVDGAAPRIAVLGEGDNAGVKLWRTVLAEIEDFYRVFDESESSLPLQPWKGEADEARAARRAPAALSWAALKADIVARELQQYGPHVALVERHGHGLLAKLADFERRVLEAKCAPDACELLLTTVHQAKGLEWDTVQLADDFSPLSRFAHDDEGGGPRFDWPSWGDDLNLWYVAVTRAKRTLALTAGLPAWAADMETIRALAEEGAPPAGNARAPKRARTAAWTLLGEGSFCKPYSAEEVRALYFDLYEPWREAQDEHGELVIEGQQSAESDDAESVE